MIEAGMLASACRWLQLLTPIIWNDFWNVAGNTIWCWIYESLIWLINMTYRYDPFNMNHGVENDQYHPSPAILQSFKSLKNSQAMKNIWSGLCWILSIFIQRGLYWNLFLLEANEVRNLAYFEMGQFWTISRSENLGIGLVLEMGLYWKSSFGLYESITCNSSIF